jgi:hypothetical protein
VSRSSLTGNADTEKAGTYTFVLEFTGAAAAYAIARS